jgi:hypothetical protein
MPIKSIPKFTAPVAKLWAKVPAHAKKPRLYNVWCVQCRHGVTITNFIGAVKGGDLVLESLCSECRGDVAKVIEMG